MLIISLIASKNFICNYFPSVNPANAANTNLGGESHAINFSQNPQLKQEFDALPAYIQESIKQSGVDICTVEELRCCAENMMSAEQ